ncbi:type IV toxin-antitoxin system AbiEi family antitoxin domain-containing protein [Nocardioides allogilvus]|uniref:type IV toxin-antitoxin system AbiEi family antitoxin domain-containing protein n=1 Tax=Nocardioides allogilvus TaxID=2072017 RepID=UPI0018E4FC25|nr:type IV toxin-antitoxin system AbiEi family antitoxin domain-containing protein [Nocardioides allogilvus]
MSVDEKIDELLAKQDGVVARFQVIEAGGTDDLIERMIRRREWVRLRPGIYLNHTGVPTWNQRAWAAVLAVWPAALSRDSALRACGMKRCGVSEDAPVRVAIDKSRGGRAPSGIVVERLAHYDDWVRSTTSPPRVRLDHAVLQVASSSSEEDAVAVISDAVSTRRTTAARLTAALADMPRLPGRAFLVGVLDDVGEGAHSVLEQRYLRDVERAHGLPGGVRQSTSTVAGRRAIRDVEYPDFDLYVELDGRLGHEAAADRWKDLERDLAAAASARLTLRPGWRQVLEACRLATTLVGVLQARGWAGTPMACSPTCSTVLDPRHQAGDDPARSVERSVVD